MEKAFRDVFPLEKGVLELHQDFPLGDAWDTGGLESWFRLSVLHTCPFLLFHFLKRTAGVTLDLRLRLRDGFGRIFGTTPEPQTAEHQPGQDDGGSRWAKNPRGCTANESNHGRYLRITCDSMDSNLIIGIHRFHLWKSRIGLPNRLEWLRFRELDVAHPH